MTGDKVQDYYCILDFVLEMVKLFRFLKIHTNTIIVAEKEPYESDDISFVGNIAATEEATARSLVPELYDNFNRLKLFERSLLANKVLEWQEILSGDEDGILRDAFRAIIADNREELVSKLQMYFANFEQLLRGQFPGFTVKLCRASAEDDIRSPDKVMQEALKKCGIEPKKKGALGDWLCVYEYLFTLTKAEENPIQDNRIILAEVVSWRNKFAHADYGNVMEDWGGLIDTLARFIPVRESLQTTIESP